MEIYKVLMKGLVNIRTIQNRPLWLPQKLQDLELFSFLYRCLQEIKLAVNNSLHD